MTPLQVFIDGGEGTTGLQIVERLQALPWVELLPVDPSLRKDKETRKTLINRADAVFLCLPDEAARESVSLCENPDTVIIDASTAHRTHPDWAYGFPELSPEHRRRIEKSNRIAVPGCHASGFCALVYPLRRQGYLSVHDRLSCFSLTGYSGGGKSMIAEFEGNDPPRGARPYALGLEHKHLPEMAAVCDLDTPPIFQPALVPVKQGMLVSVPAVLDAGIVHRVLADWYEDTGQVEVRSLNPLDELEKGRLDMEALNDTDRMELFVFGKEREETTLMIARFDNLGKGAAGAAVECLCIRLGQ